MPFAAELAERGAKRIAMVDASEEVSEAAEALNRQHGTTSAQAFQGDVTDCAFRESVYDQVVRAVSGWSTSAYPLPESYATA